VSRFDVVSRGRALVVDADSDARAAARRALELDGWTVVEAAGTEGARAAGSVDVMVLDPVLPEAGGTSLLDSSLSPVVVCSGFDRFERPSLDRGARFFLRKPIDSQELAQAVRAAVSAGEDAAAIAAENRARTGRLRADSADAREHLLAGAPLDAAGLRDQLRALTAWATGYFGVRRSFVWVLERGQLKVLAESGGAPLYPEGSATDPVGHFDGEVITAGAPLVLTDATTHPVFANHVATAVTSFYAGAPLVTAGRVALGTFCVEDLLATPFHAEDAELLTALGHTAGRLIETVAHGGAAAPTLFAAPGVFAGDALDDLLAVELARARRARSAMELALVSLREPLLPALPDIQHDVARVGRRRFALAVDDQHLAIVCGDVTRDLVRRRVDQAVSGFAWRHPVAAAGAASIEPAQGGGRDLTPSRLRAAALDMLTLASSAPGGPVQRIALV
jgi:FixJ family two-component response regulator